MVAEKGNLILEQPIMEKKASSASLHRLITVVDYTRLFRGTEQRPSSHSTDMLTCHLNSHTLLTINVCCR